ncbi:MAG TPA: class I SAM-dependent methyltransferase [Caulobacteraceae bacterium]|jgi:SAM-dependent methyltransferase|nr:class I SAM-dependent methyltransferase [Caulobacteraceae bacterium]
MQEQPAKLDFYKEHPKTCAPDDFWSQVRRTVNGEPVGEAQIQLIVNAILRGLEIGPSDLLLDLCCGNGALTDRIFASCGGGLGVDFSPVLVDVARKHFWAAPARIYHLEDVEDFLTSTDDTARFTKALCWGSFQYLPKDKARNVLTNLGRRFAGIERLLIGNLPDKTRIGDFFRPGDYEPGVENDPASAIGIWRTQDEFTQLALACGWKVAFRFMPEESYAASYRYDAVLTRTGA